MKARICAVSMLVIAIVMFALPATLLAQAASDSAKACYVPVTGNVYRAAIGDTPATCRAGHPSSQLGIPFPFYRSLGVTGVMFQLKNNGNGTTAFFENSGNNHAVKAVSNTTGFSALQVENLGTGAGGYFKTAANNTALMAVSQGAGGTAFSASANRTGSAAHFENLGAGNAIYAKAMGTGATINAENLGGGLALRAISNRTDGSNAAHIEGTGTGPALYAKSNSTGPTINVDNLGAGTAVRAVSAGNAGLVVESNRTDNGAAANIENKGTGGALWLKNATNGNSALYVENASTGASSAIHAKTSNAAHTVFIQNLGSGGALNATSSSVSDATASFDNTGTGNAIWAKSSNQYNTAYIENSGATGGAMHLKSVSATATALNIESINAGGAIYAVNNGTLPTANFQQLGSGNALYVAGTSTLSGHTTVNGNLQVNGAKNAVVPTSMGQRLMYSEEATEVWFTDYGFGQLNRGEAYINIDGLYAETANMNEPYHVFIQSYGPAELYVTERTPSGFRVKLSKGEAENAEFSYRIVAKRLNFERDRLERGGQ